MVGQFLRSGLSEEVAELRRFLQILGEQQPGFSVPRLNGGARSLALTLLHPKFPANREKYREFADFRPLKPDFFSLNCSFCGATSLYGMIRNREFTGHIRELISRIREMLRPGLERKILQVKSQVMTALELMPTTEQIKELVRFRRSGRLYDVERWIVTGKSFEGIIGKRNTLLQIAVEIGFHSLVELIAKYRARLLKLFIVGVPRFPQLQMCRIWTAHVGVEYGEKRLTTLSGSLGIA
jgi:hypothetical protein